MRPEKAPGPRRSPDRPASILVFAKAPSPGRVKTRLVPPLDPAEAARLHETLVVETLETLAAAALAPVELWCAPEPGLSPFPALAARYHLSLHRQADGDLGERMRRAAEEALTRAWGVLLLGTDCPILDRDYLAAALGALGDHDAVMGPAEDGGYVLLGIKQAAPRLFEDIPWGTSQVARVTRERMSASAWNWAELRTLWDLDRPDDLARYRAMRNA